MLRCFGYSISLTVCTGREESGFFENVSRDCSLLPAFVVCESSSATLQTLPQPSPERFTVNLIVHLSRVFQSTLLGVLFVTFVMVAHILEIGICNFANMLLLLVDIMPSVYFAYSSIVVLWIKLVTVSCNITNQAELH